MVWCNNLTRSHRVVHLRAHSIFIPNGWTRVCAEEIECVGISFVRFGLAGRMSIEHLVGTQTANASHSNVYIAHVARGHTNSFVRFSDFYHFFDKILQCCSGHGTFIELLGQIASVHCNEFVQIATVSKRHLEYVSWNWEFGSNRLVTLVRLHWTHVETSKSVHWPKIHFKYDS